MFSCTPEGVYRSSLLDALSWMRHGFGTKNARDWPGAYTQVKQIHSDLVFAADGPEGSLGRGDALVTRTAGRWIGVRTADCVPLLFADPATRSVAAVHAGWRGTVAGIAAKAAAKMAEAYGARTQDLLIAIGPCIGVCCYEVGPEVARQFQRLFPESPALTRVDLPEANRRQLLKAGVSPANIDVAGLCTHCGYEIFESYRRDGEKSGRMVAAIQVV